VNIANADDLSMCSVDILVTYDSSVLSATDIEKAALTAGYGWAKNVDEPGVARAVIATAEGETLHGEGSLFYVLFDVIGDHGDISDLEFEVTATFFYTCEDLFNPVPVDLNDVGVFTVGCSFMMGDLDGDCDVDDDDFTIALDIAVGNIEPTEEQFNAGDINGDGRINSADAALIKRIIEGLPLAPNEPERKRMASVRSSSVNVSVPNDVPISAGGSTWVPVNIDNAANVTGADIVLNYDPSFFTATGVRSTSMTEDFEVKFNMIYAGQIKISLGAKDDVGLSSVSGTLFEVRFTTANPNVSDGGHCQPGTQKGHTGLAGVGGNESRRH